ncbi:MAG: hypothetical protein AAGJ18_12340 [Bacteroidota bacterium]
MLRLNYLQLTEALLTTLQRFNYTLLTPSITNEPCATVKVALPIKDRDAFLQKLVKETNFQVIQSRFDTTILTADLPKDQLVTLELHHHFHVDRLTYLNLAEVLQHRQKSNGIYVPNLEHLLEFSILNSFLNEQGLSRTIIRQFEDLHVFLQEGLLDYFNQKYDTYFSSWYELADYKETIDNHFRKQLKQFPANRFVNRMRLGWVNMKQLMKKSAVFSYFL